MHSQIIILFSLFCVGWSRDITLGSTVGRKVFDEVRQANPAIWRQYENVTVIAPENEIISKVVITDMRPEKDGDVQIVNGGDGKKSVTIELKSPTVLRGYDFHIEVYSVPDSVVTDSEEHVDNNATAPIQSSESTELPDNAGEDVVHDDKVTLDDGNNDDDKEAPNAVADDTNTDSYRPARETEENKPETDTSEGYTSTISYETSTSEVGEPVTNDQDKTTVLPEVPEEPAIADSIRPARETVLVPSVIASAQPVTDTTESEVNEATTEAASETPVTDATTTETVITTASNDQSTFTPIAYDNSKNIPDYPSLNILDYIKNREALRPIRRTEDDQTEQKYEPSPPEENSYGTTPLAEETSSIKPEDDSVDLLPPKIDASYNNDFASSETTEHPIEGSTINNSPRAGRGINIDSDIGEEITSTTITTEETTPIPTTSDATTLTLEYHTIASIDDQLRNTRGARKEHGDENDVNISGEIPQDTNEESIPSGDVDIQQPNKNIIIVNLDELMARDENNKFVYALPIVLLINSENNFPVIKIIAEDATNENQNKESKVLYPTQPSDESLEPNEYDYKSMEGDKIEKGDYMPSGDYDHNL